METPKLRPLTDHRGPTEVAASCYFSTSIERGPLEKKSGGGGGVTHIKGLFGNVLSERSA